MLLLITLVSLIAAAALGTLAWRLSQDERRRSAARVAALTASLRADSAFDSEREAAHVEAGQPEALDLALNAWPDQAVALRADSAGDRRAAAADPIALPDAPTAPIAPLGRREPGLAGTLFASTGGDADSTRPRLVAAGVAAAVFVMAAAVAWLGARVFDPPTAPTVAAAPSAPLALLSLTSTRRGAEITVAGLVRYPASGSRLDGVSAVVLFFDADGAFLTSARARLDVAALAAGSDCPFFVRVAAPDNATRYRVSFRADSGQLVEHVDRRPPPDEQDGDDRGRNTRDTPDAAVRRAGL